MRDKQNARILLAHGGGGSLSDDLLRKHILPGLGNETLEQLGDSAQLELDSGRICFTTDSFVVKPLFFRGGDIGKLAVCGTINDLAVAGSRPVALSCSLIIEEGLELAVLDRILKSIGRSAAQNNVAVVTGDTKTVEAGAAEKIFINTAGVGLMLPGVELGLQRIAAGDEVIISGTIGDHGMAIMSQREGMQFESSLQSDCAGLAELTCLLLEQTAGVKFMRDPTRGGLAATLNEITRGSGLSIELVESEVPVDPTTQAAADMLGFDVLNIANEGKFVAVVSPESAADCIALCRDHPLGRKAAVIGRVVETRDMPLVELVTKVGGRRIVQMPYGRELPRIC